jgi:hypothetical protein
MSEEAKASVNGLERIHNTLQHFECELYF